MNTDFQGNDLMPYLKERNKKQSSAKPFLLILTVGAIILLTAVIYGSGRELLSFLRGGEQTSESSDTVTTAEQAQSTPSYTQELSIPLGARRITRQDMSAVTLRKLYENDTDKEVPADLHKFASLTGEKISVLVICSRGFETYLEERLSYIEGEYPFGRNTVGVSVCARNIAASLTLAGIGALYVDVGNTSAYGAYENAAEKIKECLCLYPDVKYIIDVRRGVYYDADGGLVAPTFEAEGKSASQMRLVIGSESSLFETEAAVSNTLFSELKKEREDCVMPTRIKSGTLAYAEGAPVITLEIGSAVSTYEEALFSAEIFAKVFLELTKW